MDLTKGKGRNEAQGSEVMTEVMAEVMAEVPGALSPRP